MQDAVDPKTQLVNVVVAMLPRAAAAQFAPGMKAAGRLQVGSLPAVAVPRNAVLTDETGRLCVPGRGRQGAARGGHAKLDNGTLVAVAGLRPEAAGRGRRQLRAPGRHGRQGSRAMTFSAWARPHRRSLLFLLAVAAIVGGFITFSLPSSLFPDGGLPARRGVARRRRPSRRADGGHGHPADGAGDPQRARREQTCARPPAAARPRSR